MFTYTAEGNAAKEEYDKCELIVLSRLLNESGNVGIALQSVATRNVANKMHFNSFDCLYFKLF